MYAPLAISTSLTATPAPVRNVPQGTPAGMGMYSETNNAFELGAFSLRRPLGMGCCGQDKGLGCACGCGGTCNKGLGSLFDISTWGPTDFLTAAGLVWAGWAVYRSSARARDYSKRRR